MNDTTAIEVLARRRLELTHQRDELDQAIKQIDATLMTMLQPGDTADIDDQPVWRVSQRRTFSVEKAREVVPAELIAAATVPTLDPKRLQELLPPAVRDACMKDGAVYVSKATRR